MYLLLNSFRSLAVRSGTQAKLFAWKTPCLVNEYRKAAWNLRPAALQRISKPDLSLRCFKVSVNDRTVVTSKIADIHDTPKYPSDIQRKFLTGAALIGGQKMVYLSTDAHQFPNLEARNKLNIGGMNDIRFFENVKNIIAIPDDAVSLRRISLYLQKYHKIKVLHGQSIQVYSVKIGNDHYLEIKALGRRQLFHSKLLPRQVAHFFIKLAKRTEGLVL
ncbi:hypothetical protein NDA14_002170 [Ustilago hordei]|nr:hypothetical protein NDA14_002170 [Ustilago hordei]